MGIDTVGIIHTVSIITPCSPTLPHLNTSAAVPGHHQQFFISHKLIQRPLVKLLIFFRGSGDVPLANLYTSPNLSCHFSLDSHISISPVF